MAQHTVEKITSNGNPVEVELAIRDQRGNIIDEQYATKGELASTASTLYSAKGDATYEEIVSKANPKIGDVYNATTAKGDYPAGTNWVCTAVDSTTGLGTWDALSAPLDLSAYEKKSDYDTTPTSGSSHAITSGGTKTAIDAAVTALLASQNTWTDKQTISGSSGMSFYVVSTAGQKSFPVRFSLNDGIVVGVSNAGAISTNYTGYITARNCTAKNAGYRVAGFFVNSDGTSKFVNQTTTETFSSFADTSSLTFNENGLIYYVGTAAYWKFGIDDTITDKNGFVYTFPGKTGTVAMADDVESYAPRTAVVAVAASATSATLTLPSTPGDNDVINVSPAIGSETAYAAAGVTISLSGAVMTFAIATAQTSAFSINVSYQKGLAM